MKRLFRPSFLIALSAALLVGALALVFQGAPALTRPVPLSVPAGDHEIVWLYPATNTAAWERFVAAVRLASDRLRADHPGLAVPDSAEAFPAQTTAVPEVALTLPGSGGRLIFRWYKLTSTWKTRDWVETLLKRRPAPLAIIGGSSSDVARDLACQLRQLSAGLPDDDRPLLLLTTATADRVPDCDEPAPEPERRPPDDPTAEADNTPGVGFNHLYPDRTFRFCFTNRQMAKAVIDFIWTQDDLRPDADPVYLVGWNDDSYSRDLIGGFWRALRYPVARTTVTDWAWMTTAAANPVLPPFANGAPFPTYRLGPFGSDFQMAPAKPYLVDTSVGTFDLPNRFEAERARELVRELLTPQPGRPAQRRPLLVVTGQSGPSRRFLHALNRNAPGLALDRSRPDSGRRIVVATGDAIAFNTIYRDGPVTWSVQDLPFALVFFCHRNPIDRTAGFRPSEDNRAAADEEGSTASTGTEDLLLYGDMIEALVSAAGCQAGTCPGPAEMSRRLAAVRLHAGRLVFGTEGVPLFNPSGNRHGGTGEHVVCLRPVLGADQVFPEATIDTWAWQSGETGGRAWQRAGPPLRVYYGDAPLKGDGADGGN